MITYSGQETDPRGGQSPKTLSCLENDRCFSKDPDLVWRTTSRSPKTLPRSPPLWGTRPRSPLWQVVPQSHCTWSTSRSNEVRSCSSRETCLEKGKTLCEDGEVDGRAFGRGGVNPPRDRPDLEAACQAEPRYLDKSESPRASSF